MHCTPHFHWPTKSNFWCSASMTRACNSGLELLWAATEIAWVCTLFQVFHITVNKNTLSEFWWLTLRLLTLSYAKLHTFRHTQDSGFKMRPTLISGGHSNFFASHLSLNAPCTCLFWSFSIHGYNFSSGENNAPSNNKLFSFWHVSNRVLWYRSRNGTSLLDMSIILGSSLQFVRICDRFYPPSAVRLWSHCSINEAGHFCKSLKELKTLDSRFKFELTFGLWPRR
jgi:hypothetical protein